MTESRFLNQSRYYYPLSLLDLDEKENFFQWLRFRFASVATRAFRITPNTFFIFLTVVNDGKSGLSLTRVKKYLLPSQTPDIISVPEVLCVGTSPIHWKLAEYSKFLVELFFNKIVNV